MAVAQPAGTNRVVSTTANIDAKFSNDGTILYLVEGQTIRAVASASGETVRRFDLTYSVGAIDISADGRFLSAVGRGDGADAGESAYKVSRIDLTTAAITTLDTRSIAPNVSVYDGAFQADGTLLLTQRGLSGASYGLINVDFNTGQFQFLNTSVKADATLIASGDHNRIYIKAQPIDDTPVYSFASGRGITAEYHNYIPDPQRRGICSKN